MLRILKPAHDSPHFGDMLTNAHPRLNQSLTILEFTAGLTSRRRGPDSNSGSGQPEVRIRSPKVYDAEGSPREKEAPC